MARLARFAYRCARRLPVALLAAGLLASTAVLAISIGPVSAQSCGGSLRFGQAVTGQISKAGATCRYTFTGIAGDVVALRMARLSTSLDPFLRLTPPKASAKTDNDSGGSRDAAIVGYVLPSTGVYSIEAGSNGGSSAGSYLLALAKCGSLPSTGRSTSGSLSSGQIACYQFSGRSGQSIDIRMTNNKGDSSFDPVLDLYTPDGKLRKSATDRGTTSAQLTDTLPSSGTYSVIARSNRDQGTGSFTLTRAR